MAAGCRADVALPRMIVAQADGCAPIVRALRARARSRRRRGRIRRRTPAGCACPGPLGDRLILRALRESGGDAAAVSEEAIARDTLRLSRATGIDAAPEGGCALAVLEQLVRGGRGRARRGGRAVQHRERRLVSLLIRCGARPYLHRMRIAILDPFSGISGDMTLGALLGVGLEPEWLRALPARLGLDRTCASTFAKCCAARSCAGRSTSTSRRSRTGVTSTQIRELVAASERAGGGARAGRPRVHGRSPTSEGEIHGMPPREVHLHEVGAVDAILDVVGAIWGLEQLGVERRVLRRRFAPATERCAPRMACCPCPRRRR